MICKLISSLFLLFIFISCAKQNPSNLPASVRKLKNLTVYSFGTQAEYAVKFQKDQTYGSLKQEVTGPPRGVAVDRWGRVFVGDSQEMTIHVYNSDGHLVTDLGRKGKGPGEFITISDIKCDSNHLFVYDLNQRRVDVFLLHTLNFSHSVNLADNRNKYKSLRGSFPNYVYFRSDGKFLVPFGKFVQTKKLNSQYFRDAFIGTFYLLDQKGDIVSQPLLKLNSAVSFSYLSAIGLDLPFYGRRFITLSDKNRIYASSVNKFLIKIFNPFGTYKRAFYYPYKKVSLTREDLDSIKTIKIKSSGPFGRFYTQLFHLIKPPNTWPVMSDMLMDDQNQLWIATIIKNQNDYEWWVLNKNGKLLTRFIWSRSKPIKVIKNGYIYTQETDTATGISQIVRYKIKLNKIVKKKP